MATHSIHYVGKGKDAGPISLIVIEYMDNGEQAIVAHWVGVNEKYVNRVVVLYWKNLTKRAKTPHVIYELSGGQRILLASIKPTRKNPRQFKRNFKSAADYVYFLRNTFIPDLEESESAYAEDFARIADMLDGEEAIDKKFLNWLRDTLLPDTLESGRTSTANDIWEGLYWLGKKGYRRNPGEWSREDIAAGRNKIARSKKWELLGYEYGKRFLSLLRTPGNIAQTGVIAGASNLLRREGKNIPWNRDALDSFEVGAKHALDEVQPHGNPGGSRGSAGTGVRPAVKIGRQVTAVEYLDEEKARAENLRNPETPWRHDYKNNSGASVLGVDNGAVVIAPKGTQVYNLPDGSAIIKGKAKRKLWGYR